MATRHVLEITGENTDALSAINAVQEAIKQLGTELGALKERATEIFGNMSEMQAALKGIQSASKDVSDATPDSSGELQKQKMSLMEIENELRQIIPVWREHNELVSMAARAFRHLAPHPAQMFEFLKSLNPEMLEKFVNAALQVYQTEMLKATRQTETLVTKFKELSETAVQYGTPLKTPVEDFAKSLENVDMETLKQQAEVIKIIQQELAQQGPVVGSPAHQREVQAAVNVYGELGKALKKAGREAELAQMDIDKLIVSLENMEYSAVRSTRSQMQGRLAELRGMTKMFEATDLEREARAKEAAINALMKKMIAYQALLGKVGQAEAALAMDMKKIRADLEGRTLKEIENYSAAMEKNIIELRAVLGEQGLSETPLDRYKQRFSKVTSWMSATWSLFAVMRALRMTKDSIVSMQVAIIDLQKVMDETVTDFDEMRQAALDLGKQMGRLPEDAAKAMNLFARQGKEQAEIISLTRVALMATNIAEMTLNESVEMLTASVLQWNLEASDAIRILDAWNEVSNKNAVTASDLAEAFSHTSSMAKNLGLDIHELNALVTILAANTGKSGGEIGRSLRFALNRLTLPVAQSALRDILGIDVFKDGTGELEDFSYILREIGDRWDDLSDAQRNALAQAFGGNRHVQDMQILFANLSTMGLKVATESMNSFGSAARENARYMASLERRGQTLLASIKELMVALGDSGILPIMQTGLDLLTGAVNLINAIPGPIKKSILFLGMAKLAQLGLNRAFGELALRGSGVRATLAGISADADDLGAILGADGLAGRAIYLQSVLQLLSLSQVGSWLMSLKVNIGQLITSMTASGGLLASMNSLVAMLKGLSVAVYGFLGPWGMLFAGITAFSAAFQFVKGRIDASSKALEEHARWLTNLERMYDEQVMAAEKYSEAIREVTNASLSEGETTERLESIYHDFRKTFGYVYKDYDTMAAKIEDFLALKRKEAKDIRVFSESARVQYSKDIAARKDALDKEIKAKTAAMQQAYEIYEAVEKAEGSKLAPQIYSPLLREGLLGRTQDIYRTYLSMIAPIMTMFGEGDQVQTTALQFLLTTVNNAEKIIDELIQQSEEYDGVLKSIAESTEEAFAKLSDETKSDFLLRRYGEYIDAIGQILNAEGMLEYKGEMKTALEYMENTSSSLKELIDWSKTYFEMAGQGLGQYVDMFEQTTDLYDQLMDKRLRVSRTLLDALPQKVGANRYFAILEQTIAAQEYSIKKWDEQRSALQKAFDMGIIGASDFYAKMLEIDRLDVFTRKRKQIREMTDELDRGAKSAIEAFIKGSIKGDEDALEKYRESMKDTRAGVLAKGISAWITESDYYKSDMARQQHLIANLFGAGAAEKLIPLEDRQFELMKDLVEQSKDTADNTGEIADVLSDASIGPDNAYKPKWRFPPLFPMKGPPSEPPESGASPEISMSRIMIEIKDWLTSLPGKLADTSSALDGLRGKVGELSLNIFSLDLSFQGFTNLPKAMDDFGSALQTSRAYLAENCAFLYLLGEEIQGIRDEWASAEFGPPESALKWSQGGTIPFPQSPLQWASSGVVPLPQGALQWAGQGVVPLPAGDLKWTNTSVPLPKQELKWMETLVEPPAGGFEWKETLLDVPVLDRLEVKFDKQPAIQFSPDPFVINIESQPQTKWTYDGKDVNETGLQLPIPPPPPDLNTQFEGAYSSVALAVGLMGTLGLSLQDKLNTGMGETLDSMGTFFTSINTYFDFMSEMMKLAMTPPESLGEKQTITFEGDPSVLQRIADVASKFIGKFTDISLQGSVLTLGTLAGVIPFLSKLGEHFGITPAFDTGGHTGRGGKLQPAGIVHKGEWVAPQWMVKKYPDAIAMLENIRQKGYQTGGGKGLAAITTSMRSDPEKWKLNPTINIYMDNESIQKHNDMLLKDVGNNIKLAGKDGWKLGIGMLNSTFSPYLKDINTAIDEFGNILEKGVSYLTFDRPAQLVEGQFSSTGPGKYLGKAAGGLTRYAGRTILGEMGLMQYVGTVVYFLQMFKQFQKEFKGASISQLLGLDVWGANIFGGLGLQLGGFTGPGGLSEIAGLVHKGEWVAPAWQVKKYPHLIQMLENIRQRGYQSGGYTLDTGLHPISPPPAESPLSEKYLGEILDAVLYIERGVGDFRVLEQEIGAQTQVMLREKAEEKKTPQNRIMEFLFGKKDTTELDRWVEFFDAEGFDGKAIVKEAETALMGLTGGSVSIAQLSETFRIMVNEGIIPSGADLADAFGYWTKNLLKFAEAFKPIDKEFAERLDAGRERSKVSTIQEALKDPVQVQNASYGFMKMLEQTESPLAAMFGATAGLVKGTGIELKLADEFQKIGLTNLPTDIISGLGQVLGGMSQNAEDAGSGMANMVMGLMSATGVGGPWAAALSPLIQTFFSSQKKEKPKEAEKISQYRKFISSSDSGISMSDRFYLSGRHSALLRGETSGPYWGEGAVEQRFDKVEINVSGAGDPIAVAKEVKKALTSDIPRNYSRQVRRGLYR